ncbi:MAG: ABC transporter permease [Nitrospirae bacterium]|nr:ABC transporter permease [Nitrospirota bacterium]
MFERIRHMIRKEFIQVLRDKRLRFFIVVPPVVQLLVFGYVVTMDVNVVPTVVVDHDRTATSREFAERFTASGYFVITAAAKTERDVRAVLDRGDAVCAIQIDRGFDRDLRKGMQASVQVVLDGTDSNTASVVMGYVNQIVERYARGRSVPKLAVVQTPVDLRMRAWYNPDLRSKNYNVPGVMATVITLLCLMLTSMSVVREREMGTMEQLMVSPLRPVELMLGKTIPFAVISVVDMLLVTVVGVFWFQVPIKGSLLVLFTGTSFYLLSVLGVGLFISTFARTQQQALLSTILFYMPNILLSGFVFPIKNMPELFQVLTFGIPLRYFLIIIRGVFLKGVGFGILWPQMAGLFVIGTIVITLSAARFRKRLQ